MDIAGIRSRSSTGLMQAVSGVPPGFAVQRRHGSRKQPLSTGAKAALLLAMVCLAWLGIRRAGSKQAAAAAGEAGSAHVNDQAGGTVSGAGVVRDGGSAPLYPLPPPVVPPFDAMPDEKLDIKLQIHCPAHGPPSPQTCCPA